MDEWQIIQNVTARIPRARLVSVGPGDDAALVRTTPDTLVTTDMLIEGVHFDFSEADPARIGRKAINVNLSDIAAMAGCPQFAVVSVGLSERMTAGQVEQIFVGLKEAADASGVAIVGGDTNRSPRVTVISVTVLGHPTGRGPVLRSDARPGDWIFVTGALGYSRLGKHLDFAPRIEAAQILHRHCDLHAMMDLSDGLAGDLFHILDSSQVGAILMCERIPVTPARPIENDVRSPLDHALHDGEDFELLFTVSEDDGTRLEASNPLQHLGLPITRIGTITESKEAILQTHDGCQALRRGGFVHQWTEPLSSLS